MNEMGAVFCCVIGISLFIGIIVSVISYYFIENSKLKDDLKECFKRAFGGPSFFLISVIGVLNIIINFLTSLVRVFTKNYEFDIYNNTPRSFLSQKTESIIIDCIIILFFLFTWLGWCFKWEFLLFLWFIVWRIFGITVKKLWEFFSAPIKGAFISYRRTAFLTMLNVLELILGFSYLYYETGVVQDLNLEAVIYTLDSFFSMGNENYHLLCKAQQKIVLFEIASFFIVISSFFVNIANLKYLKD